METYIALLLLVVPGFISKNLYEKLNNQNKPSDQFEATISALTYNIFITLVNYFILVLLGILSTTEFDGIKSKFFSVEFVVQYIIITLFTSIIIALIWDLICPYATFFMNYYRRKREKNAYLSAKSILLSQFDDGKQHIISIEKDGEQLGLGSLKAIGESNSKKELFLTEIDEFKQLQEIKPELIKRVKGIYFDFDSKIKITEYHDDIPKS